DFIVRPAIKINGKIPASCLAGDVIDGNCTAKLSVRNAVKGRSYIWSVSNDAFSIEPTDDGRKAILKALPGLKIGSQTLNITVDDVLDPKNKDSREFVIEIAENLAISAYRPNGGALEQVALETLDLSAGQQVLFAVNGYQDRSAYTWIIDGKETPLPYAADAFDIEAKAPDGMKSDGLELPDDGDGATNLAYILLTAKDLVAGETATISLAVRDPIGNQTREAIVNLSIAANPCLAEVEINASSRELVRGEEKRITLTATGGSGHFDWSVVEDGEDGKEVFGETTDLDRSQRRSYSITQKYEDLATHKLKVSVEDRACGDAVTTATLDFVSNCRIARLSDVKQATIYPLYKNDNDYDKDIKHTWMLTAGADEIAGSSDSFKVDPSCNWRPKDESPDLEITEWSSNDELCVEDINGVLLNHYNPQRYTFCVGGKIHKVDVNIKRVIVEYVVETGDETDKKETNYYSYVRQPFGQNDILGKNNSWLGAFFDGAIGLGFSIGWAVDHATKSTKGWNPPLADCADVGATSFDKELTHICKTAAKDPDFQRLSWPDN
nr:hypothetical protein [bacterium]